MLFMLFIQTEMKYSMKTNDKRNESLTETTTGKGLVQLTLPAPPTLAFANLACDMSDKAEALWLPPVYGASEREKLHREG